MGMGRTGIAVSNFLEGKCKELIVTDSQNIDDESNQIEDIASENQDI